MNLNKGFQSFEKKLRVLNSKLADVDRALGDELSGLDMTSDTHSQETEVTTRRRIKDKQQVSLHGIMYKIYKLKTNE